MLIMRFMNQNKDEVLRRCISTFTDS